MCWPRAGSDFDPARSRGFVPASRFSTPTAAILDEPVPWDNEPGSETSLYDHLRRAIKRLDLRDGAMIVDAVSGGDLKIGYFNDVGWLAYARAGTILVRRFDPSPGRPHPDLGCNVETYCGSRYVELEILGPLVRLSEGESTELTECWEIVDAPADSDPRRLAEVLGTSA